MVLDLVSTPEVAPAPATPAAPAAPLRTAAEAVGRYGAPTLRQPLPGGGERLRWIRLRETLLASMDVTTVEVDAAGRVVKSSLRTVAMRDPAAY